MGVICVAQERQPNHCDKLIAYNGARCHSQFRIMIFSEIKRILSANLMSTPLMKYNSIDLMYD